MWNLSALNSGVNLPLLAYGDVCGYSEYKFTGSSDKELIWINSIYDFFYFCVGFGCKKKFRHNIFQRIKDHKGEKTQSIFSLSDPMPYTWTIIHLIKKYIFKI